MDSSNTHICPGPGCMARIPVDLLACRRHWYQVTKATRARVWQTWADGAGAGSQLHTAATIQAVREMRPLPGHPVAVMLALSDFARLTWDITAL